MNFFSQSLSDPCAHPALSSSSPISDILSDTIQKLSDPRKIKIEKAIRGIIGQTKAIQIFLLTKANFSILMQKFPDNENPLDYRKCFILVIHDKASLPRYNRVKVEDCLDIHVLLYRVDEVKKVLKDKNRFFTNIVNNGILLHQKNECSDRLIGNSHRIVSFTAKDEIVWAYRGCRASSFCASVRAVTGLQRTDESELEVALLLLSQCIEQSCAAYIYIYAGYRVEEFSIPFLLDFCEMISCQIPDIFKKHKVYKKRYFRMLTQCHQSLRLRDRIQVDDSDVCRLFCCCEELSALIQDCYDDIEGLKKMSEMEMRSYKNAFHDSKEPF